MSFNDHIPAIEGGLLHLPSLINDIHQAKDNDGKVTWEEALTIAIKALILGLSCYSEDIKRH